MADQDAPNELSELRRRAYGRHGTAEDRRRLAELEAQHARQTATTVDSAEDPPVEREEPPAVETAAEPGPEPSRARRALVPALAAVVGLGIGLGVAPTVDALDSRSADPAPTSTPATSWRDPLLIFNRDADPRDADAPPFMGDPAENLTGRWVGDVDGSPVYVYHVPEEPDSGVCMLVTATGAGMCVSLDQFRDGGVELAVADRTIRWGPSGMQLWTPIGAG